MTAVTRLPPSARLPVRHASALLLLSLLSASGPLALQAETSPPGPCFDGFQRLGFSGGQYVSSLGAYSSYLSAPVGATNRPFAFDSGYVFGVTTHYSGNTNLGYHGWVQNVETGRIVQLGLRGGAFTSGLSGYEWTDITHAYANGNAFGSSRLYRAGMNTQLGFGLWGYHHATGTQARIGLFDAEHTGLNGVQASAFSNTATTYVHAFSTGNAFGHSTRYNEAGAAHGQSAWGYRGATGETLRFGFVGAEHTRADGFKTSTVRYATPDGHAFGESARYLGSATNGTDAWHADLATGQTRQVGLIGDGFEGASGYRFTTIDPNYTFATRHAFGTSYRISGENTVNGNAVWHYSAATGDNTRLGHFDAAHTRSTDGYQNTTLVNAFDNGTAFGHSSRYAGSASNGQSAWRYTAGVGQVAIGLLGAGYENTSTGSRHTTLHSVFASGDAFGTSARWNGTVNHGQDSWHHDAATGQTIAIGLTGAGFQHANGYRYSFVHSAFATGHAFGSANVYDGSTSIGYAAWHHDATTGDNIRLGLLTPEHVSSTGRVNSGIHQAFDTGNAFGLSDRYKESDTTNSTGGQSVWAYHAASGTTTRAGLTGAEFTGADGYQHAVITDAFANGIVYGSSYRDPARNASNPANPTHNGQLAWHHAATTGTTTQIGLTDAAHTRSTDGYRWSNIHAFGTGVDRVSHAHANGYAFGTSTNFNTDGSFYTGTSVWAFNAATGVTTRTGLYGSGFIHGSSSTTFSTFTATYDTGHAFGTSTRYNGDAINGQGLWHHNAATGVTTRLGLYGDDYTRNDNGYQLSTFATSLTGSGRNQFENGNAFGDSNRYVGTVTNSGKIAWVFEGGTGHQTHALLAQHATTGYASSYWLGTSDDGSVAWGYYARTPGASTPGTYSTFFWTADDGLHDLNDYVEGGLASHGLSGNIHIKRVNADGSLYVESPAPGGVTGLLQTTKNRFWDTNGATLGHGGNTGGVWNSATDTWGNSTGTGTTRALTPDQRANFLAEGPGGGYTVEVDGVQTVSGLRFLGNEAELVLADADDNGGIRLAGGNAVHVAESVIARIDVTLSGDEGVDKTGAGIAIFGKANTYTGGTVVREGTLALEHAQALGTGTVRVESGAVLDVGRASSGFVFANDFTVSSGSTLTGTATYTGTVTIAAGAFLSPGNSPGIVTLEGGGFLESGSIYVWEFQGAAPSVAGVDFDQILVTGGELEIALGAVLSVTALAGVDYADAFWSEDRTFDVVTASGGGSISGSFLLDTTQAGDFASYGAWSLGALSGNQMLQWTAGAIPEPSTYALIGGALALAGALIRRWRRRA